MKPKDVLLFYFILMVFSASILRVSAQTAWVQLSPDINGESAEDHSGASVSMSADGSRVAIGAPENEGRLPAYDNKEGHVRVFEYLNGYWNQLGEDVNSGRFNDGYYERFGTSVSLNADGTRFAAGAPSHGDYNTGQCRVYEYASGEWVQLGSDIEGMDNHDQCGRSVSLSADGSRLAVGSSHRTNGYYKGSVRIFEYTGDAWNQLGMTLYGQGIYDQFGFSVSFSAGGNRIAIGSPFSGSSPDEVGRVDVFEYSGSNWIQLGSNINGTAAFDCLGLSVSLSADGTRLAAGGPHHNSSNGNNSGFVRIFEYTGGAWVQLGHDIIGTAADDQCGDSVSLSADGTHVAIGEIQNDGNGANAGQVRIFEYSGGTWDQVGVDLAGESAGDLCGSSVCLNSDGTRIAMGAQYNDGNGNDSGHARVFDFISLTADSDEDGMTDVNELIAGTSPTNATSIFAAALNQDNFLQWPCVSGRIYSVYWTTNLLDNFQPLETNISWTCNTFTNLTEEPSAYFKIKVQLEE